MFSKVTVKEIQDNWDDIKNTLLKIEHPVLKQSEHFIGNVYAALLQDKLQVWKFTTEDDKVQGLVLTSIIGDPLLDRRKLLILSIYALEHISNEQWAEGFTIVKKYAIQNACEQIVAYTQNPRVLEITESLGGVNNWAYLTWEI